MSPWKFLSFKSSISWCQLVYLCTFLQQPIVFRVEPERAAIVYVSGFLATLQLTAPVPCTAQEFRQRTHCPTLNTVQCLGLGTFDR